MSETQKTVTVKALQAHTTHGVAYEIGDVYEIAADLVDTVVVQGKAAPVEGERVVAPSDE